MNYIYRYKDRVRKNSFSRGEQKWLTEKIIEKTRVIASTIISQDPELTEHPALREELAKLEQDDRSDFIEKA